MKKLIPTVGMRTIKTAVAVMLSYLVFVPFGLMYREELDGILGKMGPLYACVACIVCMQNSLGETVYRGVSRFVGVAVGGVLGVLVLTLGEVTGHPMVKALLLGVVCVAGIWLCLLIKQPAACAMASILPCIILVNDLAGVERYYYATARIIETVVGVSIAFGVNAVLPDHREAAPVGDDGCHQPEIVTSEGKNTGTIQLRQEQPSDYRGVEELTREAFWNVYAPGCDEHYLAHILRDAADFVPELDLVAEMDGQVVGSIMYTRARIVGEGGDVHQTLCFGPIGVLPAYQKRGVGRALIQRTAELAREMGYDSIFIYGDPAYYGRVGFLPAEHFGVRNGEGMWASALQGLELRPGSLANASGRFLEGEIFSIDPEEAAGFDSGFPQKEKGWSPTQDRFLELISMIKP